MQVSAGVALGIVAILHGVDGRLPPKQHRAFLSPGQHAGREQPVLIVLPQPHARVSQRTGHQQSQCARHQTNAPADLFLPLQFRLHLFFALAAFLLLFTGFFFPLSGFLFGVAAGFGLTFGACRRAWNLAQQRTPELPCGLPSVGRIHLQTDEQRLFAFRRELAQAGRRDQAVHRAALDGFRRHAPGHGAVKGGCQRVDIGPRALASAAGILFRRGVAMFKDHAQTLAFFAEHIARRTEIQQLDAAVPAQENIVRGDIAVNDTSRVNDVQRFENRQQQAACRLPRQGAARIL